MRDQWDQGSGLAALFKSCAQSGDSPYVRHQKTLTTAEAGVCDRHERRTPIHLLGKLERSRIWRVAVHLQIYKGEPNELVAQIHPRMPGDSSSSNITQCG